MCNDQSAGCVHSRCKWGGTCSIGDLRHTVTIHHQEAWCTCAGGLEAYAQPSPGVGLGWGLSSARPGGRGVSLGFALWGDGTPSSGLPFWTNPSRSPRYTHTVTGTGQARGPPSQSAQTLCTGPLVTDNWQKNPMKSLLFIPNVNLWIIHSLFKKLLSDR